MISAFHHLSNRLVRAALAICLGFCLMFFQFASEVNAAKTLMTGDFAKDTIAVSSTLKETITLPKEDKGLSEAEKEAVFLISDYISRYRNRSQVNTSITFTTMQTALNALSGHYKTFANRPVPENLKDRLNKELSKAEKLAVRDN
ncbi:photosystem II protein Psb27 [Prochlorococcus marinus]|uniref:photosystem II protein Psb27 n=1 Tax=Prochlorococcus marinus TaxID=1219 RepID=UPI0022B4F556|nr:photosystem II protein Psb27 [Prochlorococcus marinus]